MITGNDKHFDRTVYVQLVIDQATYIIDQATCIIDQATYTAIHLPTIKVFKEFNKLSVREPTHFGEMCFKLSFLQKVNLY